MKLIYQNENSQYVPAKLFKIILSRLSTVIPGATHQDVELLLTDDKTIHALNKKYRNKDKPTDVLSFSFEDPVHLGQIVISVETAHEQASQIGQPLEDELQFLFTHGLLHLLGYDHEKPTDEKAMLKKAYELLQRERHKKISKNTGSYKFKAKVWLYPGLAAWHFVTLPKKQADEIKACFSRVKRGWGSLPVLVTIGKTIWKTSIFPDKKVGSYLLPLKAEVRKKENFKHGDTVCVLIEFVSGALERT